MIPFSPPNFSQAAIDEVTTALKSGLITTGPCTKELEERISAYCAVPAALCLNSATLHGQNKDALAKMQKGNWKYDIVEPDCKCNMTDIMAAIGLVELERYEREILPRRRAIAEFYYAELGKYTWAEIPVFQNNTTVSSYHLYPLRIKGITEEQRDAIIQAIFDLDVSVNVHFIPVPRTTYYKQLGYSIDDYPATYYNFSREITLPVFEDLNENMCKNVMEAVVHAVRQIIGENQ